MISSRENFGKQEKSSHVLQNNDKNGHPVLKSLDYCIISSNLAIDAGYDVLDFCIGSDHSIIEVWFKWPKKTKKS